MNTKKKVVIRHKNNCEIEKQILVSYNKSTQSINVNKIFNIFKKINYKNTWQKRAFVTILQCYNNHKIILNYNVCRHFLKKKKKVCNKKDDENKELDIKNHRKLFHPTINLNFLAKF